MKKHGLFIFLIFVVAQAAVGQQPDLILSRNALNENASADSLFVNYYFKDAHYSLSTPVDSVCIRCNYMVAMHKAHNKCVIYFDQEPANGIVELVKISHQDNSQTIYTGTLSNGYFDTGSRIQYAADGHVMMSGQFFDNWRMGLWTYYHTNGRIARLDKYIEGAALPVMSMEFDEQGVRTDAMDEELEIIKRINAMRE